MIRLCTDADVPAIEAIINEAAQKYKGVIPADCWHEPYMPRAELQAEIAAGVQFYGFEESGSLVGVMGTQTVRDAILIRHAYVASAQQGKGIGAALLNAVTLHPSALAPSRRSRTQQRDPLASDAGAPARELSAATQPASKLLVGTWADATWAIRFYQRHGFALVESVAEKDRLLNTYWNIPRRQQEVSVVLSFCGSSQVL